jgi:hypothetical protein
MEMLPTFDQALAQRFRELMERWSLSQVEIAEGARSIGLDWSRGTVWALQRGDRGGAGTRRFAVSEFLALPAIFERALRLRGATQHFTLDDVMPRADEVSIGVLRLPGEALRQSLCGSSFGPDRFEDPALVEQRERLSAEREAIAEIATTEAPEVAKRIPLWARGSVERSVAERLDVSPELATLAGYLRWGESLTIVRNKGLASGAGEGSLFGEAGANRSAARGHATRDILADEGFGRLVRTMGDWVTVLAGAKRRGQALEAGDPRVPAPGSRARGTGERTEFEEPSRDLPSVAE